MAVVKPWETIGLVKTLRGNSWIQQEVHRILVGHPTILDRLLNGIIVYCFSSKYAVCGRP